MTDTAAGGAFYAIYKPTLRERAWRRLGFRQRFDEALWTWKNEPMEGFAEGAITTTVAVYVGYVDRLRLLISGHCQVDVYTKTSVVAEHAVSRSGFSVLPPVRATKAPPATP